jgi:hypothetical protein
VHKQGVRRLGCTPALHGRDAGSFLNASPSKFKAAGLLPHHLNECFGALECLSVKYWLGYYRFGLIDHKFTTCGLLLVCYLIEQPAEGRASHAIPKVFFRDWTFSPFSLRQS